MKEHPIIFNTEMIKAILEGRKTQTRRVVKIFLDINKIKYQNDIWCLYDKFGKLNTEIKCPYGQVGDKLWVKETWALKTPSYIYHHAMVFYKDGRNKLIFHHDTMEPTQKYGYNLSEKNHWKPSIHMPRWASRITLEITEVRVERLQEITARDCVEEGCGRTPGTDPHKHPRNRFRDLWKDWDDNPWVWVIGFRKI